MASSNLNETLHIKDFGDTDDGDLYIDVYGVPFGGPDYLGGKDFDGEYFDKSTDIGPLEVALSYFDHGKNPYFGTDPIGLAHRKGMDEEGWIYRIIVDRRKKYKNLLKQLINDHILDASSTPHQNTARKDEKTGHWKIWHVNEVTLTPTPANPLATEIIEKAIGEELEMAKIVAEKPAEVTPALPETPAEETVVENEKQETPAESLSEQIEKAFNEVNQEEVPGEKEETIVLSKSAFDQLIADVAIVKAGQATLEKGIGDIQTALPTLGKLIATSLTGKVTENLQKSASEREAEKMVTANRRVNNKLPLNAPGNH